MKSELSVNFSTRVLILNGETNKVLVDKSNAIHSQNMARIIARGLANEENSSIFRMAFGNGGSTIDAGAQINLNPPNDGTRGEGIDSRLYHETYSEIVKGINNGRDLGSFGPDGIRLGGGEEYDPELLNDLFSEEAGRKSNVVVNTFLSLDEPNTQLPANLPDVVEGEELFNFDELGLYSSGEPATDTPGYVRIDVENKNSDDVIPNIEGKEYDLRISVDGTEISETVTVPQGGSGPNGEITYGDLCRGINEGDWLLGGATSKLREALEIYITDRSEQDYGVIAGRNTFGFLVFESKTTGADSSVRLFEATESETDFFNIWGYPSIEASVPGKNRGGVNERERLLTHITFPPIMKKENRSLRIIYTLTVSVAQVDETIVETELL